MDLEDYGYVGVQDDDNGRWFKRGNNFEVTLYLRSGIYSYVLEETVFYKGFSMHEKIEVGESYDTLEDLAIDLNESLKTLRASLQGKIDELDELIETSEFKSRVRRVRR